MSGEFRQCQTFFKENVGGNVGGILRMWWNGFDFKINFLIDVKNFQEIISKAESTNFFLYLLNSKVETESNS